MSMTQIILATTSCLLHQNTYPTFHGLYSILLGCVIGNGDTFDQNSYKFNFWIFNCMVNNLKTTYNNFHFLVCDMLQIIIIYLCLILNQKFLLLIVSIFCFIVFLILFCDLFFVCFATDAVFLNFNFWLI